MSEDEEEIDNTPQPRNQFLVMRFSESDIIETTNPGPDPYITDYERIEAYIQGSIRDSTEELIDDGYSLRISQSSVVTPDEGVIHLFMIHAFNPNFPTH